MLFVTFLPEYIGLLPCFPEIKMLSTQNSILYSLFYLKK